MAVSAYGCKVFGDFRLINFYVKINVLAGVATFIEVICIYFLST